jgi:transcriptional regulator with XRE-family HTH domain
MPAQPDDRTDPNFDALRERLRTLRGERGITYDELSELTGISRTTLIAIEKGSPRKNSAREDRAHTRGSLESWWRIARALGVPLSELLSALDSQS